MNNSKYKYLLKNIMLLTISNFGTKVLSFILIPLYTNILTTAEYGTYDVYSTTISLLIPILTLNIIEAVMRFCLEKDKDKTEIFTIGIKFIIVSVICFIALVFINNIFNIFSIFEQFYLYFILLFIGDILYTLLCQFSRGIERVKELATAGALNSITMLGSNIILLLLFKQGLKGYFIANIMAYVIPSLYLIKKLRVWNYLNFKTKNTVLRKEMINYSRPLVFNNVSWWINNVSDRYIVTWISGVAANGIYSVAYKIPSILNIFQSIFSQAWTLSAVKEYENDSSSFYTSIYKIYNCGMVLICTFLIIFDKLMARILFANDFYVAWKYAPFLMISVVFGSLSGMLGGIFSAAKKSTVFAKTTMIGASVNTILNIALVYYWGPIGAAIATMISYLIVWMTRLKEANKIVKLNINIKRDIVSYILLLIQSILLISNINIKLIYIVETIVIFVIILIYYKDIVEILTKFRRGNKNV